MSYTRYVGSDTALRSVNAARSWAYILVDEIFKKGGRPTESEKLQYKTNY